MKTLFSILFLVASEANLPWGEFTLTIERDRSSSSDTVTMCRVRVVNHGPRTWPGRAIRFEARAIDQGVVVARENGRFGLSLAPYGTLETLIGFVGRYDRFEVSPAAAGSKRGSKRSRRASG